MLHRALPGLWREVGVPQGHLNGRVAHPLLDDLERDTPPGEVAAAGVPQVVPAAAPLLAAVMPAAAARAEEAASSDPR